MANYPGFLLIGVFLFAFTASSMRAGAGAMIGGRNLLRAFAFPRAVVPLSLALREALNQLPQLATLAVMLMVLPPHALPRMSWLLFPLVVLLAGLFNAGLLLFLARLTAHVPDLTVVVGMITRLLVYGSGVMFSLDRFITHPQWLAVLTLNPVHLILDSSRQLLLDGVVPPAHQWAVLAAWAVASSTVGFLYFWAGEEGYGHD
jgi:teichoic acid transport system permease protein